MIPHFWPASFLGLLAGLILVFPWLGHYLAYEDPLEPAEVAVVLRGETPFRILGALDLYRRGVIKHILVSDETETAILKTMYKQKQGYGPLDYSDTGSLHQGIPYSAIEVLSEKGVSNTADEVSAILRYLNKHQFKRAVLISSNYHTRRIRMLFDILSDGRTTATVRISPYSRFVYPPRWWMSSWSRRFVLSEYLKIFGHPQKGLKTYKLII